MRRLFLVFLTLVLTSVPVYGNDSPEKNKIEKNMLDESLQLEEEIKELEKREKEEWRKLEQKAKELEKKGDAQAQFDLGYKYWDMRIPDGWKEAVKWFRRAADQGHSRAQSTLGQLYDNGRFVLQDYNEAIKWYYKAAEQGDWDGLYGMGYMYYKGRGVTQNYIEAHKWFNLGGIITKRDEVEKKMTTEEVLEAQKLAREWKLKNWK